MNKLRLYYGVFFYFLILQVSQGQEHFGGLPLSFQTQSFRTSIPSVWVDSLSLSEILIQDSLIFYNDNVKVVARLQNTQISSYNSGIWEKDNKGHRIWRCSIEVPFAQAVALEFQHLRIPKNAQLFIYSNNRQELLGAYTSQSYKEEGVFATDFIKSSHIIIEYNAPINTKDSLILNISGIVNKYKKDENAINTTGFGSSSSCEINVHCSEGDSWKDEIQSTVRILIKSDDIYSYCSGVLLNNSSRNCIPYILTADHCGYDSDQDDQKLWRFYFHYESDNCSTPSSEDKIHYQSLIGCQIMAHGGEKGKSGSDFRLVKLINTIPIEWKVFYAGWDIENYTIIKGGGVGIHHPRGDIKKISTFSRSLEEYDAYQEGYPEAFWEVFWNETEHGHGITEGGSSGSPLFSSSGLVVGTLSGGTSYCNDNDKDAPDFYGKMAYHWLSNGKDSTQQLAYWLNPKKLNINFLKGAYYPCQEYSTRFFDKLSIFPNPASNKIQIADKDLKNLTAAKVKIYNTKGELIKTIVLLGKIGIQNIDITELSNGIYILMIETKTSISQEKFIVIH